MQETPYQLDREELAKMVAAHVSGIIGAFPEQDDYIIADKMIELCNSEIARW